LAGDFKDLAVFVFEKIDRGGGGKEGEGEESEQG